MNAQTIENLDINNIIAPINSSGILFTDPSFVKKIEIKNGEANIDFSLSSIWIGGYDAGGNIHVAAQTYQQIGDDFWSGPLYEATGETDATTASNWNKVWKINKTTIDSFKQGLFSSVPNSILNWPGNGDLGQAQTLAPFYDYNLDGNYVPQDGDYPWIKGDQAIFFIINDSRTHDETGGLPLNVEIHIMAYAFNCSEDSALDNTVFVNYRVYNRSITYNYYDLFLGAFTDLEINPAVNLVGTDTTDKYCYFYSKKEAFGTYFLDKKITSSKYYNNNSDPITGNPQTHLEYYDYMLPTNGYAFVGDPYTQTGELDYNDWDERTIISNGSNTLNKGDVLEFDVAYTFAKDYLDTNYNSTNILRQRVQDIQSYYNNNLTPCGEQFTGIANKQIDKNQYTIFPNPSSDIINFKSDKPQSNIKYEIFNLLGKTELKGVTTKEINIKQLAQGVYILKLNEGEKEFTLKFIKQ